jgi:hypothetical protein
VSPVWEGWAEACEGEHREADRGPVGVESDRAADDQP